MKRIKPTDSLVKTLIRNAQEARDLALLFSQKVEQRAFLKTYKTVQRRVTAAAIRSTGLTASIAIAEYVRDLLLQMGVNLGTARELPIVHMPNLGEARPRPYQLDNLISTDAGYGEIVCHCERVTRGEIRDALAGPIPPRSAGALARRTRAGLGRCQGFYCQAELACLLDGSVADRR